MHADTHSLVQLKTCMHARTNASCLSNGVHYRWIKVKSRQELNGGRICVQNVPLFPGIFFFLFPYKLCLFVFKGCLFMFFLRLIRTISSRADEIEMVMTDLERANQVIQPVSD